MNPVAKYLMGAGAVLIGLGIFWQFGSNFLPLGRLPGDIYVEKENFRFYFPLATSIIVSVLLSLAMILFRRFTGRF